MCYYLDMRQTSIDTYNQIKKEGLLGPLKWFVYDKVFQHGPMTQTQLIRKFSTGIHKGGTFTSRFSELERQGSLQEVGKVVCEYSGREVTLWDVTDKLPIKLEKPVRIDCNACKGKGYIEEVQIKLPLR